MSFWKKIKLGTQDSFQFIPKFYFFSLSQDKVLTLNLYDHFFSNLKLPVDEKVKSNSMVYPGWYVLC